MSGQTYSSDNGAFNDESTPRWRRWLGTEQDATDRGILGVLHAIEGYPVRMIQGIWFFLWHRIPEFWRGFVTWAKKAMEYTARVAVRLVRVIAAFSVWAAIAFGPLIVLPGVITFIWMALAIVGSIWGLIRLNRRRAFAARPGW